MRVNKAKREQGVGTACANTEAVYARSGGTGSGDGVSRTQTLQGKECGFYSELKEKLLESLKRETD